MNKSSPLFFSNQNRSPSPMDIERDDQNSKASASARDKSGKRSETVKLADEAMKAALKPYFAYVMVEPLK